MTNEVPKSELSTPSEPLGYSGNEFPDVYYGSNSHIVSSGEAEGYVNLTLPVEQPGDPETLKDKDGFEMRFFLTSSGEIIDTDEVERLAKKNHLQFAEQIFDGKYVEVNADGTRLSDRPETDQVIIDMYVSKQKR